MRDNVVIINGIALLGTNAWWTYDFDPKISVESSIQAVQDHFGITNSDATNINGVAFNDAGYLVNSVRKLQTHNEVDSIVLVTHTVPAPWIISHDLDLVDTWRFNGMGNSAMTDVFEVDTERKITTWCFGHYHKPVDQNQNGVRYLSNPRGRGNTPWKQSVYYPKKIEVLGRFGF
jgi:hypothetical protein